MCAAKSVKFSEAKGEDSTVLDRYPDTFQTLRFTVSARNIKDLDIIGKSDPYIKVYSQVGTKEKRKLIGTSETIRNVLNINWAFVFEDRFYTRGKNQLWRIEVWDRDHIGKDELAADTFVNIDEYYESKQIITVPLSTQGTITLLKVD